MKVDFDINGVLEIELLKLLVSHKETLKNKVVDSNITWETRIDLYLQIRNINERIVTILSEIGKV